jgi:hypothetical protein
MSVNFYELPKMELLAWSISFVRNDLVMPVDMEEALIIAGITPDQFGSIAVLIDMVEEFDEGFDSFLEESGVSIDYLNDLTRARDVEVLTEEDLEAVFADLNISADDLNGSNKFDAYTIGEDE